MEWIVFPLNKNYSVSETGLVRGVNNKILSPSFNPGGYAHVNILKEGVARTVSVHRMVAICFVPNPKNYPVVNHKDGNKKNNNAANLEWCTLSQNQFHAYKIGLQPLERGKGLVILDMNTGVFYYSIREVAKLFGLPVSNITRKLYKQSLSLKII